jgi:hypothetical protein
VTNYLDESGRPDADALNVALALEGIVAGDCWVERAKRGRRFRVVGAGWAWARAEPLVFLEPVHRAPGQHTRSFISLARFKKVYKREDR